MRFITCRFYAGIERSSSFSAPAPWCPAAWISGLRVSTPAREPHQSNFSNAASAARDVGRHANPASLPRFVSVGIAAGPRLAVGFPVDSAPMDDRDVTQEPDAHVLGGELGKRARLRDRSEEHTSELQ